MRVFVFALATCVLAGAAISAQAKELSKNDRFMCSWGSGIAGTAQATKLSGVSLYGARRKLQARKFTQPWMRMMAMGITEQTYDSGSRMQPASVRQAYYEGCIKHELARR
ncbi:hypothetical protein [Pseudomonas fluorescens]|uniref:Valyl-tRNA synthetase n=1 Tax=Pseudomonas fluorescens TaxID=294 RepID=A0A5E7DT19_PSEFL|nr:hypothetical protein [Pseudomonas fluorescens]VVO20657.1 hypothetical protein PS691_04163 [Pseudomonas fluorescens]